MSERPEFSVLRTGIGQDGDAKALWIAHQPRGISCMVGFLMLIGIVVTNALALMDHVHRDQMAGTRERETIAQAGAIRSRTILMTATDTICLPLPLARSTGVVSRSLPVAVTNLFIKYSSTWFATHDRLFKRVL